MEAQAWAAIALLAATLVSTLFYLGQRIDSLGARLDTRIDSLGDRLAERMEKQGDLLAGQIYELGKKLDDHLRWHAS